MKVLLVNAHRGGKGSAGKFDLFVRTVQDAVDSLVKIGYNAPTISLIDLTNIDSYIYERGTSYYKEETRKALHRCGQLFLDVR